MSISNSHRVRVGWLVSLVVWALVALPSVSRADTTFNNRPALANYSSAVDEGTWCGEGVAERRYVLGNTNGILPACDSQQHVLQTWKPITKGIIPSYVDLDAATGGVFDAWFSSHPLSNDFPRLAVTGVLIRCGLPINYFDLSSPWAPWSDRSNGWLAARTLLTNLVATAKTSSSVTNGVRIFVEGYETNCSQLYSESHWSHVVQPPTWSEGGGSTSSWGECSGQIEESSVARTTNITAYGQSVTYSKMNDLTESESSSDSQEVNCGYDGGSTVTWRAWGSAHSTESSVSFGYNVWSGDAYALCYTGLSATVDFYEKMLVGASVRTDTWTYSSFDGFEDECDENSISPPSWGAIPYSYLNHAATGVTVVPLTTGVSPTNWSKTQTSIKAIDVGAVIFSVDHALPNIVQYVSGSYSYHPSISANCSYSGSNSYICWNASLASHDFIDYTRTVSGFGGYTPQTPRYLFRWNFNYN